MPAKIIIGIDEVGRGCWAGPLVAGAVALVDPIAGLRDSKKLSKLQREKLVVTINDVALGTGLGWVWPADIDKYGITWSVKEAMSRALTALQDTMLIDDVSIIIDGHINYLQDLPHTQALIKADDSVSAVSAASIIAKVARDQYMAEVARLYPRYGFDRHVGYGTPAHIAALRKFGVTQIHRRSYKPIKSLLELT